MRYSRIIETNRQLQSRQVTGIVSLASRFLSAFLGSLLFPRVILVVGARRVTSTKSQFLHLGHPTEIKCLKGLNYTPSIAALGQLASLNGPSNCGMPDSGGQLDQLHRFWVDVRGGHSHLSVPPRIEDMTAAAAAASCAAKGGSCSSRILTSEGPWGIPLYGWKLIFQVLLTTLNVACWYVPLHHKSLRENQLGLSLANAFSGGVFLSLAFGHLIPECVHSWPPTVGDQTAPYMVMLLGYLLIFFVEKVAFDAHGMLDGHDEGYEIVQSTKLANGISNMRNGVTTERQQHSPRVRPVEDIAAGGNPKSGRGAVILLGALAVHSILEMASMGLANTFPDSALLALSIGLHQPAESIALVVAFLKSGLSLRQIVIYLSIFSAVGPVGVCIGMAVTQFGSPIIDSAMLAIVAGTFVYVGATEVIPEEWQVQEHKWKKFAALTTGIISIYIVTQYAARLEALTSFP